MVVIEFIFILVVLFLLSFLLFSNVFGVSLFLWWLFRCDSCFCVFFVVVCDGSALFACWREKKKKEEESGHIPDPQCRYDQVLCSYLDLERSRNAESMQALISR